MKKLKYIGKVIGASIVSILLLAGMSGVSACHVESELIAGQHTPVGMVTVNHYAYTDRYLHITYATTGGWEITETHVAVALSLDGIPHTNSGNPKVGKFPYTNPAVSEPTLVEYIIDLNDFPSLYHAPYYYGTLYVATHAVVQNPLYGQETAWGDTISQQFPGNNWALYFVITLNHP